MPMTNEFEDGYIISPATPYPDAPAAMDALSYFGLILPGGAAPIDVPLQMNVNLLEQFGQYFFDLVKGDIVIDREAIQFVAINGIFLWLFYGKVSESPAGTFTVVNMDGASRKPTIATWEKTADQELYQNGVTVHDYVMEWMKGGFLKVALIGKGLDHGEGVGRTVVYTYPDDIASLFDHIDTLTWNGNDLFATLFRVGGAQKATGIPGNDGVFQEIADYFRERHRLRQNPKE